MVDKSIAYRLSFYVSVAVILVFIAFIVVYFLLSQNLLRENIENKAIRLSSEVSSMINNEVVSASKFTASLTEHADFYSIHDNMEKLLLNAIDNHPYIVEINVYFDSSYAQPSQSYSIVRDGINYRFHQNGEPKIIDSSLSDSSIIATAEHTPGWTPAYFYNGTKEAVTTYVHPLRSESDANGEFHGYISSTLSLERLNSSINNIKIGQKGYAFLVDEKGNYLTHPDARNILNTNLLSVSQKVLNNNYNKVRAILSEGTEGTIIAFPEMLDYKKSWVYFSPVPQTRWILVFTMPYHELFRELYGVTLRMSILAITGMLLIYFVVSYIIRRQIRPLSRIASKLSMFSSPFKLNTHNEVKQVANSLEYLKVWFDKYQVTREEEEKNNFRHNRDLIQASEIQKSLIKTEYPAFPERNDIDLYAIYKPARKVSGDLFDYFFIDDNNIIFTIGDVSGSGVPAAIFMSVCQTVIKKNAHLRHPKKIVEATNHELSLSNHQQFFLTLFLGILNVKTGILTYCNAAHTFPFILKATGESLEVNSVHGLPLGLYSKKRYGAEQLRLEKGDTIILYTDGVYEALNENNILMGNLWIQKKLLGMKNLTAKETIEILDKELLQIGSIQKDDICLFAVKYKA